MSKINMALYERRVTCKSLLGAIGLALCWFQIIQGGHSLAYALGGAGTALWIWSLIAGWRHEAPLRRKVYTGPAVRLVDYGNPYEVPITVLGPSWTPGVVIYATPGYEHVLHAKESAVRPAFVAAPVDA